MRLSRRSTISLAFLALITVVVAALMFWPTAERRVLATLGELSAAVSTQVGDIEGQREKRVASALARLTTPEVVLVAPELGTVEGHAAIVELMSLAEGMALKVRVAQADVRTKANRAEATLSLDIVATLPAEERRQQRTVNAELVLRGDAFLVKRLTIGPVSREQPEARP